MLFLKKKECFNKQALYYMASNPMKRRTGRPRKDLEEVVKANLMVNNISEALVFNRVEWRCDPCSQSYLVR